MSSDTIMEIKEDSKNVIDIDHYRGITRRYLEVNRFKTAQFWAEKVVVLSKEEPEDVYVLALAMYLSNEYHRAAHVLRSKNLHFTNLQCCYLTASCLSKAKEFEEANHVLSAPCVAAGESTDYFHCYKNLNSNPESGNSLLASIHLEQGRVYEATENREIASGCFTDALRADVHCYEAFELLIQHQMLSSEEETKLLSVLPLSEQCKTQADQDFVRYLYESKLNKYRSINTMKKSAPEYIVTLLESSLDLKVSEAERHYYNCNFKQCYKITLEILAIDPYHLACLPIHISCLVELKYSNELFLLAHRLVDIYPESGLSWFATGCYYYLNGKAEPARRFFGKATSLDKLFGPAWLAYGHSFSVENEHDQAMAAYFKAAQLMIGCHLPLLYIGLGNGLSNNVALAEKFFIQAHEIAPNDPFVFHEMGVIAFQSEQYENARKHFEEALSKIKVDDRAILQSKWEPLLNNLGHVYRKLQMYDKAIECHLQAMILKPNSYSTYAAIGFCEILTGQTKKGVESFHKALSLKRDDTFSTTMLNYVLELHVQEAKEEVPDIDFDSTETTKMQDVTEETSTSVVKMIDSTSNETQKIVIRPASFRQSTSKPVSCSRLDKTDPMFSSMMFTDSSTNTTNSNINDSEFL